MPGEAIPIFTVESLQTPEGLTDLNRILQVFSDNVAGDTDTVRVYQGFGTPEGVITAGIGSIFQRLDGGAGTTLYVKESGTGATGWIAMATDTIVSTEKLIKGWINFNGTGTIAINDSFNVESITDNDPGNYTVTWDTDFANVDYVVTGLVKRSSAGIDLNPYSVQIAAVASNPAVGSVQLSVNSDNNVLDDAEMIHIIATGDQ